MCQAVAPVLIHDTDGFRFAADENDDVIADESQSKVAPVQASSAGRIPAPGQQFGTLRSANNAKTATSNGAAEAFSVLGVFVNSDGPSISETGAGRIFQIRVGTDSNKPVMFRLDYGPLEKGGDSQLHINIQQQGKGQRGFNKHINIEPLNLLGFTSRPFLAFPRPIAPILNPCLFMNCGKATDPT
jgi:hypothetical protein